LGQAAWSPLRWFLQEYAARNRAVMMAVFQPVVTEAVAAAGLDVEYDEQISAHHNYVATETLSDGTELIVTRKGAIRAGLGEHGLVPGSMAPGPTS
jgi:tRNA-splicing ligase RtcB